MIKVGIYTKKMSSTKKIDLVSNEGLHFLSALSLQNVALANQIQELKKRNIQRKERMQSLQKESNKLFQHLSDQLEKQKNGVKQLDKMSSENETMKEILQERALENHELQSTNEKLAAQIKILEQFIIGSNETNE